MVLVGWRDLVPVTWRVAREFARPRRSWWSLWPLALLMMPLMLIMTSTGHVYHWERRAVLGLRAADQRHAPRAIGVTVAVVAGLGAVSHLLLPKSAFGLPVPSWALGAFAAIALALAAFGIARAVTVLAGARVEPLPVVPGKTDAQWVGDLAAAAPGTDAIDKVFKPHMQAALPAGDVVMVLAATRRLAHVYAKKGGFERRSPKGSDRRLYVTI